MNNPITKVYLLDVPLENDYKNTLYFANAQAQQTYFQSRIIGSYSYNDFSYQRKDRIIRIPAQYDSIYKCNYVMYQNANYSNKWFYAFVTELEYINDGRTDLHIETDVMQTWMFDYTVKSSFVEREHVSNDTVGANTVPELLETGDYISCNLQPSKSFSLTYANCCFVIAVSELLSSIGGYYSTTNSLIPMGLYYIGCTHEQGIRDLIKLYDQAGKGSAISSVFLASNSFFDNWVSLTVDGITLNGSFSFDLSFTDSETVEVAKTNYLADNYVPRNNKLLTFPYTFLQVSNNNGSIVNYRWENFNLLSLTQDGKIKFDVIGTITPGCSYRAYPINYNNILNDYDDGINLGKLPIGSWSSDVYTNWLTQNGVNIALSVVSSGLEIAGGIGMMATGGGAIAGAGAVSNGALGIANTLGQIYQHSLIPPQAEGNVNCGDVNYQYGLIALYFKRISIKEEFARIIDKYFDMYGYKVNMVKVPNKNHRSRYWYTKTINVNINGDVPQIDMQKIKNCYDNGITFWRSASDIENYDGANNIV